jgi:hypothetical protein
VSVEEYALRSALDGALSELEEHAAAWLEARAAGRFARAEKIAEAMAEAELAAGQYERQLRRLGVGP